MGLGEHSSPAALLSRLAAARRQLLLLPRRGAPVVAYRSSSAAAAAPAPASASVLPDTLDRGSDAYQLNAAAVGGLLSNLRARVSQLLVLRGRGAEVDLELVMSEPEVEAESGPDLES